MGKNIVLRHGDGQDADTTIRSGVDAEPRAGAIVGDYSDTLGTIAQRAYGANTAELRGKIQRANTSLTGDVKIPR